ncbi:hypothetical protein OURE66S_00690 [Oligella ureolytica]
MLGDDGPRATCKALVKVGFIKMSKAISVLPVAVLKDRASLKFSDMVDYLKESGLNLVALFGLEKVQTSFSDNAINSLVVCQTLVIAS